MPEQLDGGTAMTAEGPTTVREERPSVVTKMWPRSPRSVGKARQFVAEHLDAWGLPQLTETAELIVSELVTNAVNHAHPPNGRLIATQFQRLRAGVRIEVHDANDSKPELREASTDAESGRGLALVDALTDGQWGVSDRNGPGKSVWAMCTDNNAPESSQ
ncbi:ATP-binding protein [Streptomyces sp. NBC_00370]|uniref:ATP-binding protein n=1 Tax=Streptomyces sp. NBC_00370 TaxID=2975728 RepID=UPI002E2657BF